MEGGTLMHVRICMGEHCQSLLQNRLMDLMKLGMDDVLKVPYKCCCFSAISDQGRIQGGSK